jgi:excisionase family DNA binding protein
MKPLNSSNSVYSNVEELARELGISVALAYRHLNDGRIPARRLGRRFVIPRNAVQRWLEETGIQSAA